LSPHITIVAACLLGTLQSAQALSEYTPAHAPLHPYFMFVQGYYVPSPRPRRFGVTPNPYYDPDDRQRDFEGEFHRWGGRNQGYPPEPRQFEKFCYYNVYRRLVCEFR
jgi:hypothetical protein